MLCMLFSDKMESMTKVLFICLFLVSIKVFLISFYKKNEYSSDFVFDPEIGNSVIEVIV